MEKLKVGKRSKAIQKPKKGAQGRERLKAREEAVRKQFLDDQAAVGDESEDSEGKGLSAKAQQRARYAPGELGKVHDYGSKLKDLEQRAKEKERQDEIKEERKRQARERTRREAMNEDSDQPPPVEYSEKDEGESDDMIVDDDDGYANDIQGEQALEHRAANMPTIRDPKLFQVNVAKDKEKLKCMELMNKQVFCAKRGKPLAILSVTYLENLESVIFVEAYKIDHVREAIDGIAEIYGGKVAMISADEMTNIYSGLEKQLQRPTEGEWVRIKNGLYIGDLGILDHNGAGDDRIYVKLIPRIDPASFAPKQGAKKVPRKRVFQRNDQMAFTEQLVAENNPDLARQIKRGARLPGTQDTRNFMELRKNHYRKGFVYKAFNIKQIDNQNIRPRADERQAFLEIFERFHSNDDDDSSDAPVAEQRAFLRNDKEPDLQFEDKVFVTKGDLQGSIGVIKSFVQGGQAIVLKPLNLGEGLDEITVERELIVKYFGLGDAVMITEGKYKGESAIILDISEDNVATPLIKVDSSHIEVRVNSRFLRTRDLTDTDKMMVSQSKRATQTGALSYKVGDMINYDNFRTFGHVIAVDQDTLSVVTDQGNIANIKIGNVDKKLTTERRRTVHDCLGNAIQMQDTVYVSNRNSQFFNQQGIIRNICRKCLFLWDPAFINLSNGIFAAPVGDVKIKGHDMLVQDRARHMPAVTNQNRIAKPMLLGKIVVVVRGNFKGMRGRVGHVNSDVAFLEMQGRLKRVTVPVADCKAIDTIEYMDNDKFRYQEPTLRPFEMPNQGGQTEYQKGETEYQAMSQYGAMTGQHGGASPGGNFSGYGAAPEEPQPTWGAGNTQQ